MKVMIVDDVGFVRHYLERLVTGRNHTAITASSGLQALDFLKQDNKIQVVITDLLMPGMDGIELFKAARRIDRFDDAGPIPPPAFILVTALRPTSATPRKEMNLLQQAMDIGFVDVMLKPIDNDHLVRLLDKIEQQGLGSENDGRGRPIPDRDALFRSLEELIGEALGASDRDLLEALHSELQRHAGSIEDSIVEIDSAPPEESGPENHALNEAVESIEKLAEQVLSSEDKDACLAMSDHFERRARELKSQYGRNGTEATE